MAYRAEVSIRDRVVVIEDREIDPANAARLSSDLRAAITRADRGGVIVDMSGVSFIESQGLEMMAVVQRFADANQSPILWRGLQEQAERMLAVTGRRRSLSIE